MSTIVIAFSLPACAPLAAESAIPVVQSMIAESPPQAAGDVLLAGDLLHIEVYDNPDLTGDVRVPYEGVVRFPLLGHFAVPRGMTSDGLARQLKQQLEARFLNRALVTVAVKEYASRRVYVMGGVAKPGALTLNPAMSATAIRIISEAGGLVDDANRSNIMVMRDDDVGGSAILPVALAETGGRPIDVILRPNDLILVPRLGCVYVTGQVKQPGSVPSTQASLTVTRALSIVGGFDKYARISQVQLLRAGQPVRVVDVEAILAGNGEDPPVVPGDMINVPERRY